MIQRFRMELDCALSHRLNPHPGAPIACNKDDRNIALLLFEPGLQFQTRHPRHLDLSDQTPDLTVQIVFKKFFRRSKARATSPVDSIKFRSESYIDLSSSMMAVNLDVCSLA